MKKKLYHHTELSEVGYLISANTHQSVSGLKQKRGAGINGPVVLYLGERVEMFDLL